MTMTSYEFKSKDIDKNGTLILISGVIDAHTHEQFNKDVQKILDSHKYKLIFDFSDVDYLSSRGIGSLFSFLKRCRSNQGNILLLKPSKVVINTLELLKAKNIFNILHAENDIHNAFEPDDKKYKRNAVREFASNESITLKGKNDFEYVLLVTDTSSTGIGCVYCGDPPPHRGEVYLFTRENNTQTKKATVRWVRHLEGNIYRIGVEIIA